MGVEWALELLQFIEGDLAQGPANDNPKPKSVPCLFFHGPSDKNVLFCFFALHF